MERKSVGHTVGILHQKSEQKMVLRKGNFKRVTIVMSGRVSLGPQKLSLVSMNITLLGIVRLCQRERQQAMYQGQK